MTHTLTRGEVRKISKIMRGNGAMLPKIGIVWTFGPVTRRELKEAGFPGHWNEGPRSIVHDQGGYYFTW